MSGTCFAALCRSRANRDAASSRDSMESLVANMRKHLANHPVTLSLMHCIAQLTLSLRDHPEQFTRDCMAAVLKARATHPDSSEVQHLTLSCVNNVAVLDNDLVVWLGRISSAGLPLLLEARRLRLSGAFSSFGPGPLAADLLLGVAKAALPM